MGAMLEYKIGDNWKEFSSALEHYFAKNSVEEERKVPILLTFIGQEAYTILKDTCRPLLPKDKPYEELIEILNKALTPQEPIFHKRRVFYDAKQGEDESINDWYARIKNLAEPCNFGDYFTDILRDKFITGLKSGPLYDRLSNENHKKRLKDLLDVAMKTEVALTLVAVIEKDVDGMLIFNPSENKSEQVQSTVCLVCGKINHNCKYKHFNCNICKRNKK